MSTFEQKIEAVEFLLGSFFTNPTQAERQQLIFEKAETNVHIKTYTEFTIQELKEQLKALQKQLIGE